VKHLPYTDAFVDESIRGNRYLMGCVMAEARHLPDLRRTLRSVAVHSRVHFNNETNQQKRRFLATVAEMPIACIVPVLSRKQGVAEFVARAACLTHIVAELQLRQVGHLVVESRGDDREDERVLRSARHLETPLTFEHRGGASEPMLWVADAVTWACGAGAQWRRLVEPVGATLIEIRP